MVSIRRVVEIVWRAMGSRLLAVILLAALLLLAAALSSLFLKRRPRQLPETHGWRRQHFATEGAPASSMPLACSTPIRHPGSWACWLPSR